MFTVSGECVKSESRLYGHADDRGIDIVNVADQWNFHCAPSIILLEVALE